MITFADFIFVYSSTTTSVIFGKRKDSGGKGSSEVNVTKLGFLYSQNCKYEYTYYYVYCFSFAMANIEERAYAKNRFLLLSERQICNNNSPLWIYISTSINFCTSSFAYSDFRVTRSIFLLSDLSVDFSIVKRWKSFDWCVKRRILGAARL